MDTRRPLPQRRLSETFEVRHGGQNTPFQVTLGYYDNGEIGEVFIAGGKTGSDFEAVARDGAILLSLLLQYGGSLEVVRHAITREHDGAPSTIIGAVIDKIGATK